MLDKMEAQAHNPLLRMPETTYNWQRYWVPRDGAFSYDHEGFLLAPGSEAGWARYWKTDVTGLDQMLAKPCLVLLGEPGIGKSHAMGDAEKQTRAMRAGANTAILSLDLKTCSSDVLLRDEIFKSREFLAWQQTGGELHMFLDSFDECLHRVDSVAEFLADGFTKLSCVKNLFLRIASRTAEWRTPLEDVLREKWGKDNIGVYELAPLTRTQVLEAARVHVPEPDRFVAEVVAREVVPFAIKPLTLDLLMRIWRSQSGSLPSSQREIYEQGCLELCTETPTWDTPKLRGQYDPEERMAVASHIAAANFFCNRAAICTGARKADKRKEDISLSELAAGFVNLKGKRLEVNQSAIREALNTGLFTSRGPNRMSWAHQTYGEFLAARYLAQEGLTEKQILDLLTHPQDAERRLIPQLQETAAWAATPGSALFAHLAHVQPDVLLRSDVATADDHYKAALVKALVEGFACEAVSTSRLDRSKRLRKLRHSGIAAQLRPYLLDDTFPLDARLEVIFIIEKCEVVDLLSDLVGLALDVAEPHAVREWAAGAVARSPDMELRGRLRHLALGQAGTDQNDDLRGAGLLACWPGCLTVDELFAAIKTPKQGYAGFYHMFLRSLPEKLSSADLPRALCWVESQRESDHLVREFRELKLAILDRAAEFIDDEAVQHALAKALLSSLRRHDFAQNGNIHDLIKVLESRQDIRLKLVETMVPCFLNANEDAFRITCWGLRLLFPRDTPWLIQRLENSTSAEIQRAYAHLIRAVFRLDDVEQINAIVEASERSPVLSEVMAFWIKPCPLDSQEARNSRERYLEERRLQSQLLQHHTPTPLSPPPEQRILSMLDQFEAGDVEVWWKPAAWLRKRDDGWWHEDLDELDIRQLAGWCSATPATRDRIMAAAGTYVNSRAANPEQWFSRRGIQYRPALAGVRALLLLANEKPVVFDSLSPEVWARWIPAIFRLRCFNEDSKHLLLAAKAFDRAPDHALDWTVKVLDQENREREDLWVLHKLPENWCAALGAALLLRIKNRKLKRQCFEQLLEALLKHGVPGALHFVRSQVPCKVPKTRERQQRALSVIRLMMIHGERGDWKPVWRLLTRDLSFAKELIERFGHDYGRSPAGIMGTLAESDVSALWEWMLVHYPVRTDPDRSRGGDVTTRYAMANLRDSLISHLADTGTPAACAELERLIDKYPRFAWFRQVLLRAQEQMRRLTWKPVMPANLFQMAANPHSRLIQSGDQLLDAVMDSLEVLQEDLQGETPAARFLWDGDKPKKEEDTSDWVKRHLKRDLKERGVVLGREVQIHSRYHTDIHITAVTQKAEDQPFGNVEVIIEVKGSWNRELKTAMETQLVHRYLTNTPCRHGLYLVGWFPPRQSANREKRSRPGRLNRETLQEFLDQQAQQLSDHTRTIKALVIDCSINPAPPRPHAEDE